MSGAPDVRIRAWRPGDEAGILDLILPIQRDEFGIAITAADQPDLAAIGAFYDMGGGGFWVAEQGDRIVGTIGLKALGDGGVGALRKMFVTPELRGSPHNVALRLLRTLVDHALSRRIQLIQLGTTDRFLAAHRFYEKQGFCRIDETALVAGFPRMAVDTVFYELDLQ